MEDVDKMADVKKRKGGREGGWMGICREDGRGNGRRLYGRCREGGGRKDRWKMED
jgi:hypothetical protein